MDFKWTLSRPGISLEFETGSIKEALGLLEQEGSQVNELFGWTVGGSKPEEASSPEALIDPEEASAPEKKRGRPRKPPVEAVAPDPLPVPAPLPVSATALPMPSPLSNGVASPRPELAIPADGGIPTFLKAPPPLPTIAAPPVAPAAPPPVGVLGPKVVKALDLIKEGKPDGGQALSDWLADAGLTIKGKSYDDACRAVLMLSDEKLAGVAGVLQVA